MAGAVFCDGCKNIIFIFASRRGILALFDVLKVRSFMFFSWFMVVRIFFFIERHVHFAWQAQCFAMVEKVSVSFSLAGVRDFHVC